MPAAKPAIRVSFYPFFGAGCRDFVDPRRQIMRVRFYGKPQGFRVGFVPVLVEIAAAFRATVMRLHAFGRTGRCNAWYQLAVAV